MCGRFRLDDNPLVTELLRTLSVTGEPRYTPDAAPGSPISIVRETAGGRQLTTATWWLCLDAKTMKPDARYASFNSRSDKLDVPRSMAYRPYRGARCIIPATAFIEGLGDKKTYHMIECPGRAIAFGGLYKEWLNHDTGELVYSASIITLPPVPGWESIHPKSAPLILDYHNQALMEKWLDPRFQDVLQFEGLLDPRIAFDQRITPIGKVSKWDPVGESIIIPAQVAA